MDGLIGQLKKFKPGNNVLEDLPVDRLNSFYSATVYIVSAIIIGTIHLVGNPLQCWTRREFSKAWNQFAQTYCWIQNTYYVPINSSLPSEQTRKQLELGYYQWVPIVLSLLALLFYIPRFLWKNFYYKTGINFHYLAGICIPTKERPQEIGEQKAAANLLDVLTQRRQKPVNFFTEVKHSLFCIFSGTRPTNYLTLLYMFIKLLYIANGVLQFYLLNLFLKPKYKFYGFEILRDLAMGIQWTESEHFPRVTMCDFTVRTMSGPATYSIQCVLPTNMFNEKIFIFLWFWTLMVLTVTIIHFLHLFFTFTSSWKASNFRNSFIPEKVRPADFDKFISDHIGNDGILTLEILSQNRQVFTPNLINAMWNQIRQPPPEQQMDETAT